MAESLKKRKSHHPLRIAFRWCRITVLALAALIISLLLWCNLFGLPRWVTGEIQAELRRRNIQLEFAHLYLKGFRHLVAHDVHLRSTENTNAPSFEVHEAEFLIDYQQLRRGNLTVSGVRLVSGTLQLPFVAGGSERALVVSNITADVLLLPEDTLKVANLSANTLGARATLSGELKKFSQFKLPSSANPSGGTDWQRPLGQVLEIAEQLQFEKAPEISVSLLADATDVPGSRASVSLRSGKASSKWGEFENLEIISGIAPSETNRAVQGSFSSAISRFKSEWGSLDLLKIEGETVWSRNMELLVTNVVQLSGEQLNSKWFQLGKGSAIFSSSQAGTNDPIRSTVEIKADALDTPAFSARNQSSVQARLEHPLPFATPATWLAHFFAGKAIDSPAGTNGTLLSGEWQAETSGAKSGRTEFDALRAQGRLTITTNRVRDESLGLWQFFAGWQVPWEAQITNIHSQEIAIGSLRAHGKWEFPRLELSRLDAQMSGGTLSAAAALDVEKQEVAGEMKSQFRYEKIAFLFDPPVQRWMAQFGWDEPPRVESEWRFHLPGWTPSEGMKMEILRSLELAGRFEGGLKFREVAVNSAKSTFNYTNFTWSLPDLVIERPEGSARLDYSGNVTNSDFAIRIESRLNPAALTPLFPKEQQPAVGIVKFVTPPAIDGEVRGNWEDDSRLRVEASITATNFFVKEQAFSDIVGRILITNGIIQCTDVIVHRGKEEARAPLLRLDLPGEVMFVTNLVSTIDPYIAMSLVGDDAYKAIDPYRFAMTPTVGVNGIVPLRHWSKANLHFEVAGNEFTFWRFHLPTLAGHVHWQSNTVSFSNVVGNFYGGKARWSGHFVIDPRKGEDYALYSFAGYTTNTEVKYLVADITGKTNQMEGILNGELIITSASTANDRSWNGHGEAAIEDGFLWNVPIFGVFSPILDGIAPGLGSSRITSGGGTFKIVNSVVETRDMQVRAPAFRLAYKGTVDLDGKLDARAEAMIFRDAWVIGKLFSAALWPVSKAFEAKISGTLDSPKTQLRWVPKFLLAPFRALNAIGNAARKSQPENTLRPPENLAKPPGESPPNP